MEGPGRALNGFVPNADNPFDPVDDGYPVENPTSGFTRKDEGFAGILYGRPTYGRPTGSREQLKLYCIDLFAFTRAGIGYAYGTWDAVNVRNVGYVARVLNEYYPGYGRARLAPQRVRQGRGRAGGDLVLQ